MSSSAPIFSPTPDVADAVIDALGSPDETLRTIAESHAATVEALTLWMARPDIAERVDNIESAVARRTRLIATNFLPSVVQTLTRILDAYIYEESHVPIKPGSLQGLEYRRRSRESARRAASLLLRLARFRSFPQGGVARRGEPEGDRRQPCPSRTPSAAAPTLEELLTLLATYAPPVPTRNGNGHHTPTPVPPAISALDHGRCESPTVPGPSCSTTPTSIATTPQPARVPTIASVSALHSESDLHTHAHDFADNAQVATAPTPPSGQTRAPP